MKTVTSRHRHVWWCLAGLVLLSAGLACVWCASRHSVSRPETDRATVNLAAPARGRASGKTTRTELARAGSPARTDVVRPVDSRRARLLRELAQAGDAERAAAALNLAQSLGDADAAEALDVMQALPEAAREQFGLALVELWKQRDPAEAAELVVGLYPNGQNTALLQQVLLSWTIQDWSGAVGFVQELPPGADRLVALRQVVSTWLKNDPVAASAAIEKLGEGNQTLLGLTASLWVRHDPFAATDWVRHLPDGPAKTATMSALVAAWAQQDPLGAAEHVLQHTPDPGLVISVISGLAAQEPDLATKLAFGFPAGRDRDYAIENAYYRWAQTDPRAAVDGLGRLPYGAERDTAAYAVAGSLVDSDPATATRCAAGIGNLDLRNRQVERAAREWLKRDPLTARHWILTSALSDSRKRALLGDTGA